MNRLEKAYSDVKRLTRLLNNVDFHLDEFSSGFCSKPRRAKPEAVVKAVDEAMGTLRVELARARVEAYHLKEQRVMLREALTQVKVDHLNKKVSLPLKSHALVENALASTVEGPKTRKKR